MYQRANDKTIAPIPTHIIHTYPILERRLLLPDLEFTQLCPLRVPTSKRQNNCTNTNAHHPHIPNKPSDPIDHNTVYSSSCYMLIQFVTPKLLSFSDFDPQTIISANIENQQQTPPHLHTAEAADLSTPTNNFNNQQSHTNNRANNTQTPPQHQTQNSCFRTDTVS